MLQDQKKKEPPKSFQCSLKEEKRKQDLSLFLEKKKRLRSCIKNSFVLSFLFTSSVRPILQNIEKWSIRYNKDHRMYVVNDQERGDYYKSSSSNLMGRKLRSFLCS